MKKYKININSPLDSVAKRFTATVQVVKLGLGDGVVYVNGGNFEFTILEHLVQVMDSSSGLLGQTLENSNNFLIILNSYSGLHS
jgi:hypothetical protein